MRFRDLDFIGIMEFGIMAFRDFAISRFRVRDNVLSGFRVSVFFVRIPNDHLLKSRDFT